MLAGWIAGTAPLRQSIRFANHVRRPAPAPAPAIACRSLAHRQPREEHAGTDANRLAPDGGGAHI